MIYLDYFVIGLLSGVIPTVFMTIFEFPFYRIWGIRGVYELHESEIIACKITNRKFQNKVSILGLFAHLINGSLLSVPFVFYLNITNTSPTVLIGIIYALFVWFVTLLPVHKLITNESILGNPYGYKSILVSIFGHCIYGFVLYYIYVNLGGFLN